MYFRLFVLIGALELEFALKQSQCAHLMSGSIAAEPAHTHERSSLNPPVLKMHLFAEFGDRVHH